MSEALRGFRPIVPPERERVYLYSNGDELTYREVSSIKVSESGNHYLTHENGLAIVAPGWQAIQIDADDWTF